MSGRARHVRVRLVWTDAGDKAEELESQILIDLVIDEDGRQVVGKHPAFGIYGPPLDSEVYPFILRPDGKVDYGGWAEAAEREEHLNVRDHKIQIGEFVTYETRDESSTFKIVQVTDLATNAPV